MLALRQAISAVVGDTARIVWNVCGVSGLADVGVPANINSGVSGPAVDLPLAGTPTVTR